MCPFGPFQWKTNEITSNCKKINLMAMTPMFLMGAEVIGKTLVRTKKTILKKLAKLVNGDVFTNILLMTCVLVRSIGSNQLPNKCNPQAKMMIPS